MARYAIAGRSTVVGTTTAAIASLFGTASVGGRIVEIGITNTTAVAVAAAVVRFTNATNVGAGLTEAEYDENLPPPLCTGFAGHTGAGGTGQVIAQVTLGAAVGAGFVWTFGAGGLAIAVGTANGIGVTCPNGTGQILDYYYFWDE